uniref:AB hydrolase-1 domain-containing protein n=1 Tax=Davidia involucrata TaxID=16924 RepID=A0A5B7C9F6_DAVIN
MSEVTGSKSWRDELASLVEDTGIRYTGDEIGISTPVFEIKRSEFIVGESLEGESAESESFKDQVKEFAKAWGELILELGKGFRDIVQQNLVTEDSYVVRKLRTPLSKVSSKLRFLNEYLPEDRDPVHAWPVIFIVFLLAFAALNVNTKPDSSVPLVKKVYIHPPSATRILLPDGRHMAYRELGVPGDLARFSLIAPHGFLSSRLAGIPGVKELLLEEFGVRLVTYDLPGFGESDPHPNRNLNSSALDMLYLANAVGINDKFWVLGYSSGAMHAWAALKYIPNRIAGAAMLAPMVNPYESSMTKEEISRTWEKWVRRRKLMYYLARRFPKFLTYFYRRSFLSGKHGQIDKWLSLSLGKRDRALIEEPRFEEFWHRDVEESVRQGNVKPFIEEAVLQVSNWGFSLADLEVQKKCPGKGILPWLKFMYSQAECELTGFLGPVHIWQGMDDQVVPPSMTDYVARVLPRATVHKLPDEGHFSYFFLCDECHRQIFSTLFGSPQGPLESTAQTQSEGDVEEESPHTDSATE